MPTVKTTTTNGRVLKRPKNVAEILKNAEPGDHLTVTYINTNGLEVTAHGTITNIDHTFGDIRFGENYLHINTDTGDYYFQDDGRKCPEDGYKITELTLR